MITEERQDWLVAQYVWVAQSDADWYRNAGDAVRHNNFAQFRRHSGETMRKISLHRSLEDSTTSNEERAFLMLTLWEQAGGKMEGLAERSDEELGYTFARYIRTMLQQSPAATCEPIIDETEQENTMSQIAFQTKSYVYGKDVEQMTEAELIDSIKKIENEIANLACVKTKSKKIAEKIAELEAMLAKVVEVLDGK